MSPDSPASKSESDDLIAAGLLSLVQGFIRALPHGDGVRTSGRRTPRPTVMRAGPLGSNRVYIASAVRSATSPAPRIPTSGRRCGEFLPANAGHDVPPPRPGARECARQQEQGVTGGVALCVIGCLETVDVQGQHRKRLTGNRPERTVKFAPVLQAGE